MIVNDLPWKQTEIVLSFFEIASKYFISDSFVDHDGYSISSKGFLPTVVDDHYIYYCGQESLRRNGVAIMVNKRV